MWIYIYIYKWSTIFIISTLLLNHISNHNIYIFPTISILLFTLFLLLILYFTVIFPLTFLPHFNLFIYSLLSTLMPLLLYPFDFLLFCLFLSSSSYNKFVIFSCILYIFSPHQKCYLSLSLSLSLSCFYFSFFYGYLFFLYPCFRFMCVYVCVCVCL